MTAKYKYEPDYAVPPGMTLRESIEEYGITQTELAKRLGRSEKSVNRVIKGKEPLTPQLALQLERILTIPASFWNSLETNYREMLNKIEEEQKLEKQAGEVKNYPYAEMVKLGLVEKTHDKKQKAENLLRFFGVADFSQIPIVEAAGFRIAENKKIPFPSLAAWLRHGEINARQIRTNEFNAKKLRQNIPKFKELTKHNFDNVLSDLIANENSKPIEIFDHFSLLI
jgi:addiction module HigA family antidote